jgi:hypothetical protein
MSEYRKPLDAARSPTGGPIWQHRATTPLSEYEGPEKAAAGPEAQGKEQPDILTGDSGQGSKEAAGTYRGSRRPPAPMQPKSMMKHWRSCRDTRTVPARYWNVARTLREPNAHRAQKGYQRKLPKTKP